MKSVIRCTGVSTKQLHKRFDTMYFNELSEITVEYRKYGFSLELSEQDIAEIEQNPSLFHSVKDKMAAVFRKWHRTNPSKATYHALLAVAVKFKDGATAKKICQLCAASENDGNLIYVYIANSIRLGAVPKKIWGGGGEGWAKV